MDDYYSEHVDNTIINDYYWFSTYNLEHHRTPTAYKYYEPEVDFLNENGKYIGRVSESDFINCFKTIAELRDIRIDEILK